MIASRFHSMLTGKVCFLTVSVSTGSNSLTNYWW